MQKALCLAFCLLILGVPKMESQQLDHVLGEVLIKLKKKADIRQFQLKTRQHSRFAADLKIINSETPTAGLYQIQFNSNEINELELLRWMRKQPEVALAQFNHILDWRGSQPNDPLFGSQWQYINTGNDGGIVGMDLDADLAWDISTGGLTPHGDTIVVAVIDNGLYLDHPDFQDNLWINHQEIPSNKRDDDENGYLDDYYGWNIVNQTDQINPPNISGHGTSVAGIIGAKGNNGEGVTGINWNIKLMIISNPGLFTEAKALQAYSYVLRMRQLYNDSQGEKGAFIVATNASWGRDLSFPADAPIWCDMYDLLGEVGVLNCGATINDEVNVDVEGDLPTTCPSEYLIAVTNLNRKGEKVKKAGFGSISIDIGAFGDDVFTTSQPTFYHPFIGTSAATPHVTGAIALLYSIPCKELSDLAKINPAAAALEVRDYILDHSLPNSNLEDYTVTGGQLNLFNSVKKVLDACGTCPNPNKLKAEVIDAQQVTLFWQAPYYGEKTTLQWRQKNTTDWTTVENIESPYLLSGLEPCKDYQFQVRAQCEGENSNFSPLFEFRSGDCCVPPKGIHAASITKQSITIQWEMVNTADQYLIQYRALGASDWEEFVANGTEFSLDALVSCTTYELQVQTECSGNPSTGFSETLIFRTLGCGNCIDLDYCLPLANPTYEWIKRFKLNNLDQQSTFSNGYQAFTNHSTTLRTFQSYVLELEPGFPGIPSKENFRVWIDYNQDGDFMDLEELVFESAFSLSTTQFGIINIPASALEGSTRLRVAMKYGDASHLPMPEACGEAPFYGEVEDYCVDISPGSAECDQPVNIETMEVTEILATVTWEDPTDDHVTHNIRYRLSGGTVWKEEKNVESPHYIHPLIPCETYVIQVEANCVFGGVSGYDVEKKITTVCSSGVDSTAKISQLIAMPNPFRENLQVRFFLEQSSSIHAQIYSLDGRLQYQEAIGELNAGAHELALSLSGRLPKGLHILRIQSEGEASILKILHQ